MRSLDEIEAEIQVAQRQRDVEALLTLADELHALGTQEACALEYGLRGTTHHQSGKFEAALDCFRRALEMRRAMGDNAYAARFTMNIGTVYLAQGDYAQALQHYHQAQAAYEELEDPKGLASVSVNIGLTDYHTGDYPSALERLQQALDYYEGHDSRPVVASILANLGIVHGAMDDHAAALEHYQQALAIHEESGDHVSAARVIGNIGNAHLGAGDHAAAIEWYRRALATHHELGMEADALRVTCNLCIVLLDNDWVEEARALLTDVKEKDVADQDVRIERTFLQAQILERDGELQQAAEVYRLALKDAEALGLRSKAAEMHKALRDLALKQNDLPRYVEHNDAYTQAREEIKGAEARLKIAMQQTRKEIDAMERKHERERAVLYSTLPRPIADRVVRGEDVSGDHYDGAVVLFLDVVGFTALCSDISPGSVVRLLDTVFRAFDRIVERRQVMKVKTIGDAYMAVAFPEDGESSGAPAERAAATALDLIDSMESLDASVRRSLGNASGIGDHPPLQIRIGLHIGPVVAGVIGSDRLQYDVWGDTVNTASRMESTGESGRIHVSKALADALRHADQGSHGNAGDHQSGSHRLVARGTLDVKGKGPMRTYWLER